MRKSVFVTGVVALLGLSACGDQLSVTNLNNPDVERVLSTAVGIQATVAGFGSQLHNPQRASESINTQAKIMAEESYASVANFGMAARAANRSLIINDLGNDHSTSNLANFNSFQRLARSAANALSAFNNVKAADLNTLSTADENRMRAFAYLILGRAMANVAVGYDSGAVATEVITSEEIPGLVSAADLNVAAIAALDSAVIIAGRGMSDMPITYLSVTAPTTQAVFIRLARSYRARARAAVARTPAERAAVNWAAVIADATNGISADHVIQVRGTTGWNGGFDVGQMYVSGGWHSYPMTFAGMADSSGGYQTWFNTLADQRRAFLVQTRDRRWAQGSTRTLQQADTPTNSIFPRYIRNRPTGDDVVSPGTGESWYDHRRYGATNAVAVAGPYTELSKTEIDMLAAEGYIRTGLPASAEPLIDISRLRNNLPTVVGVGAAGTVSGGAACVPKLPNGTCGTLLDALKYEKRMETAFTGYLVWFTDGRGWGDLPRNTAVEWPVPFQEMQARQQPFYNGIRTSGATSTYGF